MQKLRPKWGKSICVKPHNKQISGGVVIQAWVYLPPETRLLTTRLFSSHTKEILEECTPDCPQWAHPRNSRELHFLYFLICLYTVLILYLENKKQQNHHQRRHSAKRHDHWRRISSTAHPSIPLLVSKGTGMEEVILEKKEVWQTLD